MAAVSSIKKSLLEKFERAVVKSQFSNALGFLDQLSSLSENQFSGTEKISCHFALLEAAMIQRLKPMILELIKKIQQFPNLSEQQLRILAEAHASVGKWDNAIALAQSVPDDGLVSTFRFQWVDQVIAQSENPDGTLLPVEIVQEISTFRQAFKCYHEGQIAAARELLANIRMASPVMEWKLMLRGLIAWTDKEDSKAIDNWGRLKVDRLPFQLIAPLLRVVDQNRFHQGTPPQKVRIDSQSSILFGELVQKLTQLGVAIDHHQNRNQLYLLSEEVVPQLKKLSPGAFGKLSKVVYWSILQQGSPHELSVYPKVFGKPKRDPEFALLKYVKLEQIEEDELAELELLKYINWLEVNLNLFPSTLVNRLRGILSLRLAHLGKWLDDLEETLFPNPRIKLKEILEHVDFKNIEHALKNAHQFMPAEFEPLNDLFILYSGLNRSEDLEVIVSKIEQGFREHPEALSLLEAYYAKTKQLENEFETLKQAIKIDPFDKKLSTRFAQTGLRQVRLKLSLNELQQATEQLSAIESVTTEKSLVNQLSVRAIRTVIQAKIRKNPIDFNSYISGLNLQQCTAGVLLLWGEANRLKLPKKNRDELGKTFKELLLKLEEPEDFRMLLSVVKQFDSIADRYPSFTTHSKLIQTRINLLLSADCSEINLQHWGILLHELQLGPTLKKVSQVGRSKFPYNAYFWFFSGESILLTKKIESIPPSAIHFYVRSRFLMINFRGSKDYSLLKKIWEKRAVFCSTAAGLIRDEFTDLN